MKERFRRWMLRLLGIEPILLGFRADLDATTKELIEVREYGRQLEEKLGMRRIIVEDNGRHVRLLATPAEMEKLREESRQRAAAQVAGQKG